MRIGGDGRKGRKRAAANFTGHLWHNLRLFGLAKISTARTTTMLARKLNRLALIAVVGALPATPTSAADDAAKEQVRATELAFARTMAERNLSAFGEFIAGEAVFFDGTTVLRGKSKVIEEWAPLFTGAAVPFSWEPDQVEVLESGTLALSTGPVRDPGGKVVARFNTIWRLEGPNKWRVVFDKGSPPSPGPK